MDRCQIREAHHRDWADVAALLWEWDEEDCKPPVTDYANFQQSFVDWMKASHDTHRCWIAQTGDETIGIGFLARTSRAPRPSTGARWVAEIQTVYVRVAARGKGFGARLVQTLLKEAQSAGADRAIVHSRIDSQPVYHRAGFSPDPLLMELHPQTYAALRI